LELLDVRPTVRDLPGAVEAPRFKGAVLFDRVSFAYRHGPPVLSELTLEIPSGQRVALVGPTGSGKTTLVSLLPRFYDCTGGRVCLDGRAVREFTLASLRKHISLVFQEPVLFAATIAENIAYGKPEATMDEIVQAARLAGIHPIITALPEGYDTELGERGATLSGGQRQCVAIARAMIKNAPILILDEPLTGLDSQSAVLVNEALRRLMEGRTVITITHQFNSIRDVDRVVVLDRGRIVQDGTPEALWQREGLYHTLQQLQVGAPG
jgi:ABC-type multidrug transport system fused ATPase/permease subunit